LYNNGKGKITAFLISFTTTCL